MTETDNPGGRAVRKTVITAAVALAMACTVAAASPDGHRVPDLTPVLCAPGAWKWADGGYQVLRNSVFGAGDQQCVSDPGDGPGFTVTRSTTPVYDWDGYGWLYEGCWYDVCSQKGPLPAPVAAIRSARLDLDASYPADGQAGNVAADDWFSRTDTGDVHPDQMELMIWAAWDNVPLTNAQLVSIGGRWWWLEDWPVHRYGTSWEYVQLRAVADQPGDLADVNMLPVLAFCERHGWISARSWAMTLGAGFELEHKGAGDTVLRYTALVNGQP
jgi:hypothetical protein